MEEESEWTENPKDLMTSRPKRPSKIWQLEPRSPGESFWRFKKWNSKHKL
jgi:hypothetical protein